PSQPGSGGSRPAADLERGWLAVAALAEGSDSQLAYYSNACGLAMDYCLSAPGTVVVTGTDDAPDAPSYWRWSGTSFAAPIVSAPRPWSGRRSRTSTTTWCGRPCSAPPPTSVRRAWTRCSATGASTSAPRCADR